MMRSILLFNELLFPTEFSIGSLLVSIFIGKATAGSFPSKTVNIAAAHPFRMREKTSY